MVEEAGQGASQGNVPDTRMLGGYGDEQLMVMTWHVVTLAKRLGQVYHIFFLVHRGCSRRKRGRQKGCRESSCSQPIMGG